MAHASVIHTHTHIYCIYVCVYEYQPCTEVPTWYLPSSDCPPSSGQPGPALPAPAGLQQQRVMETSSSACECECQGCWVAAKEFTGTYQNYETLLASTHPYYVKSSPAFTNRGERLVVVRASVGGGFQAA